MALQSIMTEIHYIIYKNKLKFVQKLPNPSTTVWEFLKIISKKHKKNLRYLYCFECDIYSDDILKDYLEFSDNVFVASEDLINPQPLLSKIIETKTDQSKSNFIKDPSNKSMPNNNLTPKNDSIHKKMIQDFKNSSDITNFEIIDELYGGSLVHIYKVTNLDQKYYAETIEIPSYSDSNESNYLKFYEQKKLLFSLNHGCLSKYIKFYANDFNDEGNPVFLSSLYSNGNLKDFLQPEKKGIQIPFFNSTQRLIVIYGIASGMAYLHSKHINFPDLLIENIQLDEYLFPKISFYGSSTLDQLDGAPQSTSRIIMYINIDNSTGNEKDVFLFSLIVFELLMKKVPFKKLSTSIVSKNERPIINDEIPSCFKQLIQDCWNKDISKRPSFEEIKQRLMINQEFVNDEIDSDVYYEYIKLIDEYQKIPKEKNISFEAFVNEKSDKFSEYKLKEFNDDDIVVDDSNEDRNILKNIECFDVNNYSLLNRIGEGLFGEVYTAESVETGLKYVAKISKKEIFKKDEVKVNVYREALIISQLHHPCILKFIGYSQKNFQNQRKPVILTEFTSNGSLQQLFEYLRKDEEIYEWDETQKLMTIYGISSCMSYLHSKNIVHRDLKPGNILLDDYLFPKLANFCFSTLPENFENLADDVIIGFQGMPKYFAPEIFENEDYSKKSDVYAFAVILYEIVTGEKPFPGNTVFQIMNKVMKGERPLINESVPECYRKLIEKCWSQDPKNRPSFDQINTELLTNDEFIQKVNKNDFDTYVNFINEFQQTFEKTGEMLKIEDIFSKFNKSFKKVDLHSIYKEHIKKVKIELSVKFLKLDKYIKQGKVGEGNFGVIYKVQNNKNERIFAAKISKKSIDEINEDELISIYREVNIIAKLNHPCILKFIGYSPLNFEEENHPVIVTEFSSVGTLSQVLKMERCGLSLPNWDNTMKLINIYGIAAGLSYLHHRNIIHRDLKPDNILLDSFLHPKLADFGLSKELTESDLNVPNPTYKFKGTPTYSAPEILSENRYTKAGDIYAFGLIVYEIVTNEIPFKNITNFFVLFAEVVAKKVRPELNFPIQDCYRNLIERCWAHDANKRPTIDDILDILKNDLSFLDNDIDDLAFSNYAIDIDEFLEQNEENNKLKNQSSENQLIDEIKNHNDPQENHQKCENNNNHERSAKIKEVENDNDNETQIQKRKHKKSHKSHKSDDKKSKFKIKIDENS